VSGEMVRFGARLNGVLPQFILSKCAEMPLNAWTSLSSWQK
jgi:hypothetical protein